MSPTPRAAIALAVLALAALVVPLQLAALGALALAAAVVVDAAAARHRPEIQRHMQTTLARGVSSALTAETEHVGLGNVLLRQPQAPDIEVSPTEGTGSLDTTVVGRRRGRHVFPGIAARRDGPLGLGRWFHRSGENIELLVYPDLPAARRLAIAVRTGRFRDPGRRTRGQLGLGTEFESIRDYLPDDDIRQVNWRATARLGRPMSNQYRVEQDRDVICAVDTGRLMKAPLGNLTRLDAALDVVAAVAFVADEIGDRCGTLAFDTAIRRHLSPRRGGGDAVVRALFDVEPTMTDSDYELAFQTLAGSKRSFVLVLTDLLEPSAARPLVEAVPVLARRHVVVVASTTDPDLEALIRTPPTRVVDAYATSVAVEVLGARSLVTRQLQHAGAEVIEAPPGKLGAACIGAYLRAKARARL